MKRNGCLFFLFDKPDELVFGTESADAARERFARAMNETIEHHSGKHIAVVAHGTVITALVSRHNAIEPFKFWKELALPSFVVLNTPDFKVVSLRKSVIN